ncbi:glycine cleavage system aminomethyltransferase GcvT [Pararhizobium haloflavum]|uniref:glycine cleavage system aminomethyltransferase GcvT n=1 Tax=Pararhizobium haloflavum TaxID=2037914 RepID=UPI000C192291|nr:glycine cleavage system aminomethyltransferase GcvT [Pararhizobium haloflavum]
MADSTDLKTTPLHAMHSAAGARMVPFAGYDMPVQYAPGVLKEHLHTRAKAGLFDVSHMGQVELRPKDGMVETAARALETLVPVDILGLKPGRQRYALFTNEEGGVMDDLMVANRGDHLFLVVNAACKAADIDHLKRHLGESCDIVVRDDRALLALQGPEAARIMAGLAPETAEMRFMDVRDIEIAGAGCVVSRSGYTGEDGFEISVPGDKAGDLASALLEDGDTEWIGLGARDSLRLEAGLCLYGNDLDAETTPVESNVAWAIQKVRRRGGAREGGFPGAGRILSQLSDGASRRRVGLKPRGRAPVRAGAWLFADEKSSDAIGKVTSGGFGPSVDGPVAMGLVPTEQCGEDTILFAEVRGKRLPVAVCALPFVKQTYKR